jgi:hypothetical protein
MNWIPIETNIEKHVRAMIIDRSDKNIFEIMDMFTNRRNEAVQIYRNGDTLCMDINIPQCSHERDCCGCVYEVSCYITMGYTHWLVTMIKRFNV